MFPYSDTFLTAILLALKLDPILPLEKQVKEVARCSFYYLYYQMPPLS